MASRNTPSLPNNHPAPVIPPFSAVLRRPEPDVIDQRQQQIDPAGHHRRDVTAPATGTMKQPGGTDPKTQRASVPDPAPRANPEHPQGHAGKGGNQHPLA